MRGGWRSYLCGLLIRVIKACGFAICSVWSSMSSSLAMDFASESIMLAASVLACL